MSIKTIYSGALLFLLLLILPLQANTYYVNGTAGSDSNPGTEERPFASIQKAADVMQPGDDCLIRKGTYRETVTIKHSGAPGLPIRFAALQGESVCISGADQVAAADWQVYEGSIYQANVSQLGAVSQLFVGEKRMKIARFPNNTSENMMSPVWGVAESAVARQKPALSQIIDPLLADAPDLTGGDLWLLSGLKWVAFNSIVEEHSGASVSFVFPADAESYAYKPEAGSNYFITGLVECIDMEGEWSYHAKSKTLYFQAPGGVNPAELDVQARTRQWGFDVSNQDYIEIDDINFFAAAVNFLGSENCLLKNARVFYPVPFYAADSWATTETPQNAKYAGIKIGGKNNVVQNCEVAFSWGEGIVVAGLSNTVDNCLVHDMAWLCTDAAPIHTSGSGHSITNNTIYNAGRSGLVHRKSQGLEIAYNDIYDCGLLTTDLGATYCYKTDGAGTVIHHNWVHDVTTTGHTAGIYLDNNSSNFIVHHNVVWNTDDLGIQTNLDAHNHQIYNNTIWNCSQAMGGGGGNQVMENQIVYNNLSNSGAWFGTDVQQNLAHSDPQFVDAANGDFRLQADSPARDDYVITAQLLNGDFESGVGAWTGAGGDLTSVNDPVHSGAGAAFAHNRNQYWQGARQSITDVLKDNGPGRYTIQAWVKLQQGSTNAYLRFKIVDDDGDHYPGTQRKCNAESWTKVSYATTLNWKGALREAVFELMTTGGDELTPFYIDDCALLTPESPDTTKPRGGILIPGITDDVLDGKPDAGAYEYGGANADWTAGSSLSPGQPKLPVGVRSQTDYPVEFGLEQNYPNPFNPSTRISYRLAASSQVKLQVFDLCGRLLKTLVDGYKPAGRHAIEFADPSLPSGAYFYRLQAGEFSAVRKMALLH